MTKPNATYRLNDEFRAAVDFSDNSLTILDRDEKPLIRLEGMPAITRLYAVLARIDDAAKAFGVA